MKRKTITISHSLGSKKYIVDILLRIGGNWFSQMPAMSNLWVLWTMSVNFFHFQRRVSASTLMHLKPALR